MVHAAVAADTNEAEEIQEILRKAGIESELEPEVEADAIESGTDPDDLVAEP